MRLLYPSSFLSKKSVDESFLEEFEAARALDIACSIFSVEDFESGSFNPYPTFNENDQVLYRGWMLTPEVYADLSAAIVHAGGKPVTSPDHYRLCHHLPEWYPICTDFTPETVVLPVGSDIALAMAGKDWPAFFVKDYVKSLTTLRGSIAKTIPEIDEILSLIEHYRGSIEGGICIRKYESLQTDTEERYFVFKGRSFARNGVVPDLVHTLATLISSPFFSVDLVLSQSGQLRLIELGDGQVSDCKKWPKQTFASIFKYA